MAGAVMPLKLNRSLRRERAVADELMRGYAPVVAAPPESGASDIPVVRNLLLIDFSMRVVMLMGLGHLLG
jgi:hypothetical protein